MAARTSRSTSEACANSAPTVRKPASQLLRIRPSRGGLGPLADPIQERVVPEHAVLGLRNPVAFIREQQQLGWNLLHLQRRKQLHSLAHGYAIIRFAVNH